MNEVREAAVAAVLEVKGVELTPELRAARLEDLEIDSLDLIEVGMIIEERFDVELEPSDFDGVETVEDLLARLDQKVADSRA